MRVSAEPIDSGGPDHIQLRARRTLRPLGGLHLGSLPALLAIPVLGEWPSAIDWTAIAAISIGSRAVRREKSLLFGGP